MIRVLVAIALLVGGGLALAPPTDVPAAFAIDQLEPEVDEVVIADAPPRAACGYRIVGEALDPGTAPASPSCARVFRPPRG